MLTTYFATTRNPTKIDTEFYSVHRNVLQIPELTYSSLIKELEPYLNKNSSRISCLQCQPDIAPYITYYGFAKQKWTTQVTKVRDFVKDMFSESRIDYSIVHYYRDYTASIAWHSDKEAKQSPIYIVNIGGTRRFCLRAKANPQKIHTFDLNHGDILCMKVGCQLNYEHCIKSVKKFNDPRFSITLRCIDIPPYDFIYDGNNVRLVPSTTSLDAAAITNDYAIGARLFTRINHSCSDNDAYVFTETGYTEVSLSLLKSNIQKAIRRGHINIAIGTALHMMRSKMEVDLLRRLTIIAFEDIGFHANGFCVLMWLYLALSSNKYKLTKYDICWILTWIHTVCTHCVPSVEFKVLKSNVKNTHIDHEKSAITFALESRILYGGFGGEIEIMKDLLSVCDKMKNTIPMFTAVHDFDFHSDLYKLVIIPEAIDFHCFPNMIVRLAERLDNISENDLKSYIWHFDSKQNIRTPLANNSQPNLSEDIWLTKIRPHCTRYRRFILSKIR